MFREPYCIYKFLEDCARFDGKALCYILRSALDDYDDGYVGSTHSMVRMEEVVTLFSFFPNSALDGIFHSHSCAMDQDGELHAKPFIGSFIVEHQHNISPIIF